MLKYKVKYTIKGAHHRPAYSGSTDIWVNNITEIEMRLYNKLKTGPFFDINRSDLIITKKEYLTLVD